MNATKIVHRFTGKVIAEGDCSVRELAEQNKANLTGANLAYADLSGVDLRRADLTYANLTGADLSGADLTGANLAYATLRGATLSDADLSDADMRGAALAYSALTGAALRGANLCGADLTEVIGLPEAPVVPQLDAQILARLDSGDYTLDMSDWHRCETTHCRAGHAIDIAGAAGYALERATTPHLAGRLIYEASTGRCPDFFESDAEALADIRECAAEQGSD